jgi:hypothetical protein
MDQDLRDALSSINTSISTMRGEMNARVDSIQLQVINLRRDVFGTPTDPPRGPDGEPVLGPDGKPAPAIPLAKLASSSSMELEAHEGRLIALERNTVRAIELGEKANDTLDKQSNAMGLGRKGLDWLLSKDGRATMVRVATAAAATYAALHQAGVIGK